MKAKDFLNEFYPVTVQVYSDRINDIAFLMDKFKDSEVNKIKTFDHLFLANDDFMHFYRHHIYKRTLLLDPFV